MKPKARKRKNRHTVRMKLDTGNGRPRTIEIPVTVKNATVPVTVVLEAEHVEESIRLKGVGDSHRCSMAVCTRLHEDAFPHPVTGWIDWTQKTAMVGSKDNKRGLPSECVAYVHHDKIAALNDTMGGQQKLLEEIRKKGPKTIRLYPPDAISKPNRKRAYKSPEQRARAASSTTTKRRSTGAKGARLRFIHAQMGGDPTLKKAA